MEDLLLLLWGITWAAEYPSLRDASVQYCSLTRSGFVGRSLSQMAQISRYSQQWPTVEIRRDGAESTDALHEVWRIMYLLQAIRRE